MLTDSYPANQAQNSSKLLLSSSLVTQVSYSKSLKFINETPPINEELSKYLSDQLFIFVTECLEGVNEFVLVDKAVVVDIYDVKDVIEALLDFSLEGGLIFGVRRP